MSPNRATITGRDRSTLQRPEFNRVWPLGDLVRAVGTGLLAPLSPVTRGPSSQLLQFPPRYARRPYVVSFIYNRELHSCHYPRVAPICCRAISPPPAPRSLALGRPAGLPSYVAYSSKESGGCAPPQPSLFPRAHRFWPVRLVTRRAAHTPGVRFPQPCEIAIGRAGCPGAGRNRR